MIYPPDPTGEPENANSTRRTRDKEPPVYRSSPNDPTFGFLIASALALGLTALPPGNVDLRYTLAWLALAVFGVLAWLLGSMERISQEKPENLIWGLIFAFMIGAPLLAFGGDVLSEAAKLVFPGMPPGTLLAYLVFVMPLAETLFFRGVLQQNLRWWIVGLLSTLWAVILFFPEMWGEIIASPAVGIIIVTALAMMNVIYSYVRWRNNLAAAWICQIVVNLVVIFLPSL